MTDRMHPSPFRRQVNFRVGADDWPLLEALAREHGGIQAGLLAAVRVYAVQRLQVASASPPAKAAEASPHGEAQSPADSGPETPQPSRSREPFERRRPQAARREVARASVELNVLEAAPVLGLSPGSLRGAIRRGTRPGRRTDNGRYLAELDPEQLCASGIELTPRGAAEVLALRPATIRRRCKEGRYPNARDEGGGWRIPASDLFLGKLTG
jgi:hypothetical protein